VFRSITTAGLIFFRKTGAAATVKTKTAAQTKYTFYDYAPRYFRQQASCGVPFRVSLNKNMSLCTKYTRLKFDKPLILLYTIFYIIYKTFKGQFWKKIPSYISVTALLLFSISCFCLRKSNPNPETPCAFPTNGAWHRYKNSSLLTSWISVYQNRIFLKSVQGIARRLWFPFPWWQVKIAGGRLDELGAQQVITDKLARIIWLIPALTIFIKEYTRLKKCLVDRWS